LKSDGGRLSTGKSPSSNTITPPRNARVMRFFVWTEPKFKPIRTGADEIVMSHGTFLISNPVAALGLIHPEEVVYRKPSRQPSEAPAQTQSRA